MDYWSEFEHNDYGSEEETVIMNGIHLLKGDTGIVYSKENDNARKFIELDIPIKITLGKIDVLDDIYLLSNEYNYDSLETILENSRDKQIVDLVKSLLREKISPDKLYFGERRKIIRVDLCD